MPKPSVFVTRALPGDALPRLAAAAEVFVWPEESPPPHEEIVRRAAGADALLTMLTDRIDAAVLDAGRRLRVVANMAVGYDNIDVSAATARGKMAAMAVENVLAALRGEQPPNCVNPEAGQPRP